MILCSAVARGDGLSFYSQGKFKEAIPALVLEIPTVKTPSELEARVKAAEDIYAQDLDQNPQGLIQVYKQALVSPALHRYLKLRVEATRDALQSEIASGGTPTSARWALLKTKSKSALKVDHAREGQLRAIAILARRDYRRMKASSRLLDYARALHLLNGGGTDALEEFLELKSGSVAEKKEAFEMLQDNYQREFPKGIPELKREQLAHFKKLAQ